ncbi:MAG TPA: hypothetical protein ENK78_06680 [Thiothrix sp.]|nr:hypothetical protein [Thiothrix sp.]
MIYLVAQISLFILIATLLGALLGWWFRGRKQGEMRSSFDEHSLEDKRRLEQCRREAAALRREAKAQQEMIDRFSRQKGSATRSNPDDSHLRTQLETAQAKITALMEEVQLRDDTIIALQKDTNLH